MIEKLLIWLLNRWQNRESLKVFGATRSSKWPKVRAEHLKKFPTCAVCGKSKDVIPHHKKPFHLHPELELNLDNLVSLCESAGMNCHITFGHLGNFQHTNFSVEDDVRIWYNKIQNRP